MNAISFSLYGANNSLDQASHSTIHHVGILRNAELISEIYPGWKMVVYVHPEVPKERIAQLQERGAEARVTDGCSMFHRFLIADDLRFDRYLIRDADSRLNKREAGAVAEWIESGKSFHVIRDHPQHPQPIMGGLWGGTPGKFSMASLMQGVKITDRTYMADMRFLERKLWPLIKNDCLQHDLCTHRNYPGAKPFSATFDDMRFCGEVFNEKNEPRRGDWERRINWMTAA